MTCKDCIHYNVCFDTSDVYFKLPIASENVETDCEHFKDKSLIVELPCEVGDKVYYIKHGSVFDYTIDEIENYFTATENGNIDMGIYFEKRKMGKEVFLTREEAEKNSKK